MHVRGVADLHFHRRRLAAQPLHRPRRRAVLFLFLTRERREDEGTVLRGDSIAPSAAVQRWNAPFPCNIATPSSSHPNKTRATPLRWHDRRAGNRTDSNGVASTGAPERACSAGPRTAAKSMVCAARCGAGRSGRRKLSSGGGPAPGRVFSAGVSNDAAAARVSSNVVCLEDGSSLPTQRRMSGAIAPNASLCQCCDTVGCRDLNVECKCNCAYSNMCVVLQEGRPPTPAIHTAPVVLPEQHRRCVPDVAVVLRHDSGRQHACAARPAMVSAPHDHAVVARAAAVGDGLSRERMSLEVAAEAL